eukprot:gene5798-biopygen5787
MLTWAALRAQVRFRPLIRFPYTQGKPSQFKGCTFVQPLAEVLWAVCNPPVQRSAPALHMPRTSPLLAEQDECDAAALAADIWESENGRGPDADRGRGPHDKRIKETDADRTTGSAVSPAGTFPSTLPRAARAPYPQLEIPPQPSQEPRIGTGPWGHPNSNRESPFRGGVHGFAHHIIVPTRRTGSGETSQQQRWGAAGWTPRGCLVTSGMHRNAGIP